MAGWQGLRHCRRGSQRPVSVKLCHFVERYETRSPPADRKGWICDDRWKQAFKSMTADGQLARDDWLVHADFRAKSVRNGPDQHFCCRRRHLPGRRNTPTDILDEQSAVGIEHHFDHRAVIKGRAKLVAERLLKLSDKPGMGRGKPGMGRGMSHKPLLWTCWDEIPSLSSNLPAEVFRRSMRRPGESPRQLLWCLFS